MVTMQDTQCFLLVKIDQQCNPVHCVPIRPKYRQFGQELTGWIRLNTREALEKGDGLGGD